MAVILYVETNFLISIAKGQDPQAETLLQNTPSSVRIAIPSICYVEALSRWQDELKYSERFQSELNLRINDANRDRTSPHAELLVPYLENARVVSRELLNDVQRRLSQALDQLLASAEMIALTADILQEISKITLIRPKTALIRNDLMDNLILHCILGHARLHPTEDKVFLSGNTNDFGTPQVREALRNAGVDEYFRRAQDFLGWLQSQPSL